MKLSWGVLCVALAGCESPQAAATIARPDVTVVFDAGALRIEEPRPVVVVDAGAARIEGPSLTDTGADVRSVSDDAAADAVRPTEAEDGPLTLSLNGSADGPRCVMRVERGQLHADCDGGALECAEAARGSVSRAGEDDVVWLCTATANAEVFVVVTTDREALWGQNAMGDRDGRMCSDYEASVSLVTVAALSTRALLVKARGCTEPGQTVDRDHLWIWRGSMMRVASSEFVCTYLDTRVGPSTGLRGQYSCEGTYIEAPTPSAFNKVGRGVAVRQRGLGAGRLMMGRGHVQARFAWSEALEALGE